MVSVSPIVTVPGESSSLLRFLCFGRAKELILSTTVAPSTSSFTSSPDELEEVEDVDVVVGSKDTDGMKEVVGDNDGETDMLGLGDVDGVSDG